MHLMARCVLTAATISDAEGGMLMNALLDAAIAFRLQTAQESRSLQVHTLSPQQRRAPADIPKPRMKSQSVCFACMHDVATARRLCMYIQPVSCTVRRQP